MTIPISPLANLAWIARFVAALIDPVRSSMLVAISPDCNVPSSANSPSNFFIVLKCCWAKTSVGASNAA